MEVEDNDTLIYYYNDSNDDVGHYHEFYISESQQLWQFCVWESARSVIKSVTDILLMNLFYGAILTMGVPEWLYHLISMTIGAYSLITMSQGSTGLTVVLVFFLASYQILLMDLKISEYTSQNKFVKILQKISLIDHGLVLALFFLQYAVLDPLIWSGIQGILMVFIMKMMSLSCDLKTTKTHIPTLYQFMGYIFSGVNIMFGPWISYATYIEQLRYPTKKSYWWIIGVVRAYLVSIFFLVTSNCFTDYFIPDDSNRLLVAYKKALTFRTSHYFISYLSEAMMLAAGWKNSFHWFDEKQWRFTVTEPYEIEFPLHLAAVVTKWNLPMHKFLKKYIYRKLIHHGKFWAILMTFVMSSLFHGFEIKVSVVLIAIGLFSYMQILVRDKISKLLSCCVQVRSCEEQCCKHYYKKSSYLCKLLKLCFGAFTVLHLIFLGVLMDSMTTSDIFGILKTWDYLYHFGWWIMLFNFSFIKLF